MLERAQLTLGEVQQQFEDWRHCRKNRRSEIPTSLWEAVVSLSKQYSLREISKRLRLNHSALRDRIAGDAIKRQESAFVEIDMTPLHTSVGECIIEIDKPDARMKITLTLVGGLEKAPQMVLGVTKNGHVGQIRAQWYVSATHC